jgi:hypothetical protein
MVFQLHSYKIKTHTRMCPPPRTTRTNDTNGSQSGRWCTAMECTAVQCTLTAESRMHSPLPRHHHEDRSAPSSSLLSTGERTSPAAESITNAPVSRRQRAKAQTHGTNPTLTEPIREGPPHHSQPAVRQQQQSFDSVSTAVR